MSLGRDYVIRYIVDANGARQELLAIQQALAGLDRQAIQTKQSLDLAGASLQTFGASSVATGQQIGVVGDGLEKTHAGLVKSIAGFAALGAATEVLSEIAERTRRVVEYMGELGDKTAEVRDKARELATLQGKSSPDNATLAGVAEFGIRTGMTPQEAIRFQEQLEGSMPAGLQKGNVTEEIAHRVSEVGARFGQRVGLRPETSGDLAGVLSQFAEIPDVESGARMIGQIHKGLDDGRGRMDTLMSSFINLATGVVEEGGQVQDPSKLAVYHGVMSTMHPPREAATYTRIFSRELRELNGAQGEALQQLGIEPTAPLETQMAQMFAHLEQRESEGIAPRVEMSRLGFSRSRGIDAVAQLYQSRGMIEARLKDQEGITGQGVEGKNDEFFRSMAGRDKTTRAMTEGNSLIQGLEYEPLQIARRMAVMRMRQAGSYDNAQLAALDQIADAGGLAQLAGVDETILRRVNKEVVSGIASEASAVGLDRDAGFRARLEALGGDYTTANVARFVRESAPLLEARGADFTGGPGNLPEEITIARHGLDRDRVLRRPDAGPAGPRTPPAMSNLAKLLPDRLRRMLPEEFTRETRGPGLFDDVTPTDEARASRQPSRFDPATGEWTPLSADEQAEFTVDELRSLTPEAFDRELKLRKPIPGDPPAGPPGAEDGPGGQASRGRDYELKSLLSKIEANTRPAANRAATGRFDEQPATPSPEAMRT